MKDNRAMGDCFVIYRLPNKGMMCKLIEHELCEVRILDDGWQDDELLNGFVIVPFDENGKSPSVYLPADGERIVNMSDIESGEDVNFNLRVIDEKLMRKQYHQAFDEVMSSINNGKVDKVVLARKQHVITDIPVNEKLLFKRACARYPTSFVALISTPMTGKWLMATPEVLLEQDNKVCHTMALAGTRTIGQIRKEWGSKNEAEQIFVVDHIAKCLERYAMNLTVSSPSTVRAGFVEHIQSDFTFRLRDGQPGFQRLIMALHPTPAVCGVPKDVALTVIHRAEQTPRSYYSGYCGIFRVGQSSHVYVSLRCMSLDSPQSFTLYAGGGIVSGSQEEDEWDETRNKMQTMMKLFDIN